MTEIECLREQLAAMTAHNVMLREWIKQHGEITDTCTFNILKRSLSGLRDLETVSKALAATADLDGLILCHAEPVAFIEKITSRLAPPEDNHYKRFWMCYEPLYRAWEPKPCSVK